MSNKILGGYIEPPTLSPQEVYSLFVPFYQHCQSQIAFKVTPESRPHIRNTQQVDETTRIEWRSSFSDQQRMLVLTANKLFTSFIIKYFSNLSLDKPSIDLYDLIDTVLKEFIDFLASTNPGLLIAFRAALFSEKMIGIINIHEVLYDVIFNGKALTPESFTKVFAYQESGISVQGISTCPYDSSSTILARNINRISQNEDALLIRRQPVNSLLIKDNYQNYVLDRMKYIDDKIKQIINS